MFEYVLIAVVLFIALAMVLPVVSHPIRLRMVSPGDVIRFMYNQPDYGVRNRLCKVCSVRDTHKHPILPESERQRDIDREQFLITALCDDGVYRSFYEEGIAEDVMELGWIARVCLYLRGVRFRDEASAHVIRIGK